MNNIVRIVYDNTTYSCSIIQDSDGFIDLSGGLESIVSLSLFTDGYDVNTSPHRGWWADSYGANPKYKHGSKLWTLRRKSVTQRTINEAKRIVSEAIQFLIDDKIAQSISVQAERASTFVIAVETKITQLNGTVWRRIWEINTNEL